MDDRTIKLDISTVTLEEAAEAELASGRRLSEIVPEPDAAKDPGDLRARISALRDTAQLVRASEPQGARRLIIDLALYSGRSFGDVGSLTFGEAIYLAMRLKEQHATRAGRVRRTVIRGSRR